MPWPLSQDYNEAIQTPVQCFSDAELKQGEAVTNALGLPVPCSGNFADVYAVQAGSKKWAVKCFTRQIPGLQERYLQISKYLQQVNLPFMVEFNFLEQGIRVRGEWYPVLKMQWVEGFNLNAFVRDNLDKPQLLQTHCQIWVKLAQRLNEVNLAHCDLQHGNVLLVPSKAGSLGVRLVDYDGMCVPALELLKSIELGHAAYQHPQRLKEGTYGLHIDRFPHLVIYTALRALSVGGKALWDQFDNGDNLLFKPPDFAAPDQSAVFQELLKLNDPEVRRLTQVLLQAAKKPIGEVPLLDSLVAVPKPPSKVTATLPPAAARTMAAPAAEPENVFASATGPASGARLRRPVRRNSSAGLLIGGGVAAAALVAGAVVFFSKLSHTPETGAAAVITKASPAELVEPGRLVPPTRQVLPPPPTRPTVPPTQPMDPPAAKLFAITSMPEKLVIEPGREANAEVVYDPAGLSGQAKLVFSGGPAGVSLKNIKASAAEHKLTFTFAAQADAAEASKPWRLHLVLGVPEQQSAAKEMLIVVQKPAPPTPPVIPTPPVVKLPVPSKEKLDEALATIKGLFKVEYAKARTKDRIDLATKLLDTAAETKNDPAGRFVLLSEAGMVAAGVGEIERALTALDLLMAEYAVDGVAVRAAALVKASGASLSPAASRSLVEACLKVIEDAAVEEKLDVATTLLKVAEAASRKAQAPALVKLVKERAQELQELQKEIDLVRQAAKVLKDKPDDPEALTILGKYACFSRRDWTKGLTLLASGNDEALKKLAQTDLANPATAEDQIKIGDGWWDLGETKSGSAKLALLARAAFWYEKALPSQTGLTVEKLTKRIAQADESKPAGASAEARKFAWASKPTCLAYLHDGKRALVGDADRTLSLLDLRTGKVIETQKLPSELTCISVSADGKYAVTLDGDRGINVWETDGLKLNNKSPNQGFETAAVAFTFDNKVLTVHKGARPSFIHGMIEGDRTFAGVNVPRGNSTTCGTACLGGNLIALGTQEGMIEAVLSVPKKPTAQLHLSGHTKEIVGLAVTRDGRWLLSGSADKTARLWDLATGKTTLILRGHAEPLTTVAMSLDARVIVTGSEDKTIRMWSAKSGRETRRFTGHTGTITGVSVAPDGRQLLSTSADNTVRLWELFK